MSFARLVSCFLLLLSFCLTTLAQNTETGSIAGAVTDNSGAFLPGAQITITNGAGLTKTATAGETGQFEVGGLPPGTYTLTVSMAPLKDFQATGIAVTTGQTAHVDATLVPAEVKTTVSVEGQSPTQVETENAQIGGTLTETEVTTIGLNGRNFTQLIGLAPGTSNQTGQDEALVGAKGSVKYSVNGGRVEYNTFDVDGGDVLNPINGQTTTLVVYPSLDSIQELQVLTSNYGAMYGRSASGTILATTKSGGTDFHGDGYFFARSNVFNDRNYFDLGQHAPLYQKYDPGGTIGGPLYIPGHYNTKKDKTFFFFSEEYRHEREPTDFNQAVPSLAERDCTKAPQPQAVCLNPALTFIFHPGELLGDFSDVCPPPSGGQVLFTRSQAVSQQFHVPYAPDCPGFPTSNVYGGIPAFAAFNYNLVPITADPSIPAPQSAQSAPYLLLNTGVIPLPNSTTGCNSSIGSCYDSAISPLTSWREELFRIDQNFNQKLKGSFRLVHDAWSTTVLAPQWAYIQNSFPTIENTFVGPGLSGIAHFTDTISTTLVNDFAFAYAGNHISLADANGPGATWQRPAGLMMGSIFPSSTATPFGGKIPGIVIGGTNAAYGEGFAVDPAYMPWTYSNPTYTLRDDVTLVRGTHTLQFGVLADIAQRNEINPPVGANTGDIQGIITFTNVNSFRTTGNAFADFLQSRIRSFQQDSAQLKYHNNYEFAEPYLQDDWHATRRLTLNLGLRLSLFGMYHEKNLNSYNWVASAFSSALASAVSVNSLNGTLQLVPAQPGMLPTPIALDVNNLDPHIVNGIVQCGKNGIPASCMSGHLVNPAPRIGFAWDPFGNGKTSIRGGYGIFYEHGVGNEANTGSLEGSPANYPNGVVDMTQNNPANWLLIGKTQGASVAYPINVTSIPTAVKWTYVQQWSLSVQRDLPWSMLGTLAYVGSKGTHLPAELQLNQMQPVAASQNPFQPGQPLTLGTCDTYTGGGFTIAGTNNTVLQGNPAFGNLLAACYGAATPNKQIWPDLNYVRSQFAAYPGMGEIFALQDVANSTYHALQVTLRRTKGPLTMGVSYSYSHSIDDASDRADPVLNSFNLAQNRASSNFDQRHVANLEYIYQIPMARIVEFLSYPPNRAADPKPANPSGASSGGGGDHHNLLQGWEISGITLFATGTPFSVINGGSTNGTSFVDNAGVASGFIASSYPDITRNPGPMPALPANSGTFGPLLGNPDWFVAPQGLTFGDAGRNSFSNPSRLNFDVSLIKNFKTSEHTTLEFRAESYNVMNHTQFRIYDSSRPGVPGNNTVTCYAGANNSAGGDASCLIGNSFLHPIDAHRPRTMQFGVKLYF